MKHTAEAGPTKTGKRTYFLAFDHRLEFRRTIAGLQIQADDVTRVMVDAKTLLAEASVEIHRSGLIAPSSFGALVDEEYGASAARILKDPGICIAMPIEVADSDVFDFCYGKEFPKHVEEFNPDFVKALVRFNIDGNAEANAIQIERLLILQEWVDANDRQLLFELIVPGSTAQLVTCASQGLNFISDMRASLQLRAIAALQASGIAPHIWKIEGVDDPSDASRIGALVANENGRRSASCIVLSSGQTQERVNHWLAVAAKTPGYSGFAIGRSIWSESVRDYIQGQIGRSQAVSGIVQRFVACVDHYERNVGHVGSALEE